MPLSSLELLLALCDPVINAVILPSRDDASPLLSQISCRCTACCRCCLAGIITLPKSLLSPVMTYSMQGCPQYLVAASPAAAAAAAAAVAPAGIITLPKSLLSLRKFQQGGGALSGRVCPSPPAHGWRAG
jgi:hypothetical protein